MSALAHHLAVVPAKHRREDRRQRIHPALAGIDAPFVFGARPRCGRGEAPAPAAVQLAARHAFDAVRLHEDRGAHLESQLVGQAARPREAPHRADAVGIALHDLLDFFHVVPPPRPFARLRQREPDALDRRDEVPACYERVAVDYGRTRRERAWSIRTIRSSVIGFRAKGLSDHELGGEKAISLPNFPARTSRSTMRGGLLSVAALTFITSDSGTCSSSPPRRTMSESPQSNTSSARSQRKTLMKKKPMTAMTTATTRNMKSPCSSAMLCKTMNVSPPNQIAGMTFLLKKVHREEILVTEREPR